MWDLRETKGFKGTSTIHVIFRFFKKYIQREYMLCLGCMCLQYSLQSSMTYFTFFFLFRELAKDPHLWIGPADLHALAG